MTNGFLTINQNGRFNVTIKGKFDIIPNDAFKGTCCCCKPYTLASFISVDSTWNLRQYQSNGIAPSGRYWMLTNNYTSYVPSQKGCVDDKGKLVGLPSLIAPDSYKYTWVFRLEIGCKDSTGRYIKWADGSQTPIFQC
jgi:hypothetical protein